MTQRVIICLSWKGQLSFFEIQSALNSQCDACLRWLAGPTGGWFFYWSAIAVKCPPTSFFHRGFSHFPRSKNPHPSWPTNWGQDGDLATSSGQGGDHACCQRGRREKYSGYPVHKRLGATEGCSLFHQGSINHFQFWKNSWMMGTIYPRDRRERQRL